MMNKIMTWGIGGAIALSVMAVGLRSVVTPANAAPAPQSPAAMASKLGQVLYKPAGSFQSGGRTVHITEDLLHHNTCYTVADSVSCVHGVQ